MTNGWRIRGLVSIYFGDLPVGCESNERWSHREGSRLDTLPAALTSTKGIHLGRSGRQKITEWTLMRRPYYRLRRASLRITAIFATSTATMIDASAPRIAGMYQTSS